MNRYLIILLFLIPVRGIAQDSLQFDLKPTMSLYVTQVLISDLRLGFEHQLIGNKTLEVSVGYGFSPIIITKTKLSQVYNPLYENKLTAQIIPKNYLGVNYQRMKRGYWGLPLIYSYETYTHKNVSESAVYGQQIKQDRSGNTVKLGIAVIYGAKRYFSNNLIWEYYLGGGAEMYKRKTTIHSVENPITGVNYDLPKTISKKGIGLLLQGGIKICYPF